MKKVILSVIALACCLLPQSCSKEGKGTEPAQAAVLGVNIKDAQALYEVPKGQSVSLEVSVVADPTSAEPYTISVAPSSALVAAYNTKNGTSYEMLPATAFQFASSSVILPKYTAKSSSCELRLTGSGCEEGVTYVLPVVIDGVKGGSNFDAPDEKAAFILFKMGPAQAAGSGTKDDPYTINGLDTFMLIGSLLKDDATVYFKLTGDVDFTGVEFGENNPWIPINYAADDAAIAVAEKRVIIFDGNNHKIIGFKAGAPLFYIFVGTLENLTVENAEIEAEMANGGAVLVGIGGAGSEENGVTGEAKIKNVKIVNAKVSHDRKRTGGLISWLKGGSIENVNVECEATSGAEQQVGVLAGRIFNGSVINCSTSGSATAKGAYVGGLVGYVEKASFQGCSSSAAVKGEASYPRGGGLIGEMHGGSVEKCYATGNVEGTAGHFAGGLIGVADAKTADITITKSYATGNVTYSANGNKAGYGGLLGRMESGNVTITDCYSTGAVKAFRWSAGFVGDVNKGVLTITNGFTKSDISAIGPDGNGAFQRGLVIGNVRTPAETTIKLTKFVAWKTNDTDAFCFPADAVAVDGNYYGNEGTISAQATSLGWSTDVWNLGGNEPKLK